MPCLTYCHTCKKEMEMALSSRACAGCGSEEGMKYDRKGNPIPSFTCTKDPASGTWEITDNWNGESIICSQQTWEDWADETDYRKASRLPR